MFPKDHLYIITGNTWKKFGWPFAMNEIGLDSRITKSIFDIFDHLYYMEALLKLKSKTTTDVSVNSQVGYG
jgi:hypothetical protein